VKVKIVSLIYNNPMLYWNQIVYLWFMATAMYLLIRCTHNGIGAHASSCAFSNQFNIFNDMPQ